MRLFTCFLGIALSVLLVAQFGKDGAFGDIVWVANGLMLAYLLHAPRWRWPAYLGAFVAGMMAGSILMHERWQTSLLFNGLNLVEVLTAALLLRPKSTHLPRLTDRAYVIRFLAFAVLAGPLLSGILNAVVQGLCWHVAPVPLIRGWVTADALGMAVTCPIFIAIFQSRSGSTLNLRRHWIYLALLVSVTLGVFAQSEMPVLFLIYPALILVLLRLGLGWAAASSLFVAFAGGWFTLRGSGPLAASGALAMNGRCSLLQVFVATGVFMLYSVSVVLDSRRGFERRLEKIASLHAMVTEHSRDAIILADLNGNRSYVSAAVERLIGWPPKEFAQLKSLELVHREDLPGVLEKMKPLRSGQEGVMIECRIRKCTGGYIWAEANLRLVRDPKTGKPSQVLNIVRDVTERKRSEEARVFYDSLIRAIQEVSLDGILVIDNAGNVAACNKKFAETWQVSMPEIPVTTETVGASNRELLLQCTERVKNPDEFLQRIQEIYADPESTDHSQIDLKDGRTLERYSSSLRDGSGHFLGRVWFIRDISAGILARQQLEDAYRAVEALASTDGLTGLANRRRFDQVLNREWRRALREQSCISMLMIDVDHFKLYNDAYGHPRGDSCLRQVAEAAQDVVSRPGDLVARFGGEEFAVILPNTDSDGALQLAEEIREAMQRREVQHAASLCGIVTVSVGCATMTPALGLHAVNLIEHADEALYKAKNGGRNRVCRYLPGSGATVESVPGGSSADRLGKSA